MRRVEPIAAGEATCATVAVLALAKDLGNGLWERQGTVLLQLVEHNSEHLKREVRASGDAPRRYSRALLFNIGNNFLWPEQQGISGRIIPA